jgi:uncharacterized protein (UPF0332 family)
MNENIEEDLLANFKEFLESGKDELEKQRYNSSVTSYFKAVAVLCDLKIYQERRLLPKNHQERFLFLQVNFPEVYKITTDLFNSYRDSYNIRMQKQDALKLKENVEKLKKLLNIE